MIDRSKSPHTQFPEQSRLPQVHETEVGKARLHLLGGAEEPACRLTLLFDGSYPELGNSAELGLLATQWPDATSLAIRFFVLFCIGAFHSSDVSLTISAPLCLASVGYEILVD